MGQFFSHWIFYLKPHISPAQSITFLYKFYRNPKKNGKLTGMLDSAA